MKKCRLLGGTLIEDKYGKLRAGAGADDSCSNLEYRAERLGNQVFGPTKTFRDTPECREMVYDYTCLWWGSDNEVYTNNCKKKEFLYDESVAKAADPPCLSFCTEVANTCANRPDWIKLCEGLMCKESGEANDKCMDGPTQTSQGAAGGIACNKYTLVSFYSAGERTRGSGGGMAATALAGFLTVGLLLSSS